MQLLLLTQLFSLWLLQGINCETTQTSDTVYIEESVETVEETVIEVVEKVVEETVVYVDIEWDNDFEIDDLPRVALNKPVTYEAMVEQLKNLKTKLYNNFTKIESDETPPPRGSQVRLNKDFDVIEIITQVCM